MIELLILIIFKLLCGHAIADFALQSEWMAKNKNRNNKSTYVPEGQTYVETWFYVLGAHGFIHGFMVYALTGSLFLGIIETISHFTIDFLKCDNYMNPHQDQLLHIGWKLLYAVSLVFI